VQQLKSLCGYLATSGGDTGEIARGTIEARYHARLDGVAGHRENDRDCLRRRLGGLRPSNSHDNNHRHMPANKIGQRRLRADNVLGGVNGHVAAHNTTAAQSLRLSSFEIS
jgi:hypothetical protein